MDDIAEKVRQKAQAPQKEANERLGLILEKLDSIDNYAFVNTKQLEDLNGHKVAQLENDSEFREEWITHKLPENKKTNYMLWIGILAICLNTTPDSFMGVFLFWLHDKINPTLQVIYELLG